MQERNISFIQCSTPKFQILYKLEWHALNSFRLIRWLGAGSTGQVVRARRHGVKPQPFRKPQCFWLTDGELNEGDFERTCLPLELTAYTRVYGCDPDWRELARDFKPMVLSCDHLGGTPASKWVLELESIQAKFCQSSLGAGICDDPEVGLLLSVLTSLQLPLQYLAILLKSLTYWRDA